MVIEANPLIVTFCERPTYVDGPKTPVIDFWVQLRGAPASKFWMVEGLPRSSSKVGTAGPNRLATEWSMLSTANRAQVLILMKSFRTEAPIIEATELAADAAAWTLFAMYWCGTSHPSALFNKPLHPPTGLVRWISQFHVDQQRSRCARFMDGLRNIWALPAIAVMSWFSEC